MESFSKTFAPGETEAVLFHKGCTDGFAAAWVAHLRLGFKSIFYHEVAHGEEPPWEHLEGKNVLVVDFSWPRDITLKLKELAKGFVLLDHHKTAQTYLSDVVGCKIDPHECGATLAWQFFSSDKSFPLLHASSMPAVLNYVRDRDLWLWKMPDSRAFSAALYVDVPRIFDRWDALFFYGKEQLIASDGTPDTYRHLIENGGHYLKMRAQLVEPLAKWALERSWRGHQCRVAEVSPRSLRSEVGEALLRLHPDARVAICWTYDDWRKVYNVSLRAREGETDVTGIAEAFGGGGHPAAASFAVDLKGRGIEAMFEE